MPTKRFEYLPHTADVAFEAYGKDFGSALESAAVALLELMLDVKRIRGLRSKKAEISIEDSASTREDLVWYILQDILSKVDAEKLNAYDFRISYVTEARGRIRASGKLMYKDNTGDFSMLSVKAITPHNLNVKQHGKRWSVSVIADV